MNVLIGGNSHLKMTRVEQITDMMKERSKEYAHQGHKSRDDRAQSSRQEKPIRASITRCMLLNLIA
ncbi:hypothetical protein HanHA300_Chr02g0054051 [Helianthus annuus]|nr:hypothetical protein HanHA300_Chr02g0054051 [Helianthus annuus]KAJ0618784.1 hypothetical protein HanHA89_Chr02g0057501 [Helianthus annuus]